MWLSVANRSASASASFSSSFPLTENPIVQDGGWTLGGTTGLDWQNPKTIGGSPGTACAIARSGVAHFDDALAIRKGQFSTTKHYAKALYRRDAAYSPVQSHEVELLTGFDITAHVAKGYEWDGALGGWEPVRWNGPLDGFEGMGVSGITTLSGADPGPPVDGDLFEARYDSTSGNAILTLIRNTIQVWQVQDATASKILSGAPGMGYFVRDDANVGISPERIAWRTFECGSL